MGLSLTGCQIDATYPGLLKTCDNSAVTSTYKPITDGCGNDMPLSVSSLGTRFAGDVDFSAATVSGLPDQDTTYTISSVQDATNAIINLDGSDASNSKVTLCAGTNITLTDDGSNNVTIDASGGAAGLVNGTGTDSLKNADSLVTTPAVANGDYAVALGDGACSAKDAVAIGRGSIANGRGMIAIGHDARATDGSFKGMAIGCNTCSQYDGIAIGKNAASKFYGSNVVIGNNACDGSNRGCGVFIGLNALGTAGFSKQIAIGGNAKTCVEGSIALGAAVTATRADALTTCEIELCTAGGGLYLTTPDGLAQPKLSVDDTCQLLVDGTPVGGGGAAGLVNGTGADSLQSDASLTTVAADAAQPSSIAIGDGAQTPGTLAIGGIAIGSGSCVGNYPGVAIGCGAKAVTNGTVIGPAACSVGNQSTSIGIASCSDSQAVAIGREANAAGNSSFAGGDEVDALGACSIAIGRQACACGALTVTIGKSAQTNGFGAIALGNESYSYGCRTIAIGGVETRACTKDSIAIGTATSARGLCNINIGVNSGAGPGYDFLACRIGIGSSSCIGACSVVVGHSSITPSSDQDYIVIGNTSEANAIGSVALGNGVTAAKADTVTVKELELCTAGGGLYLTTPDGLAQPKISVDNTCQLLVDGTPVGGGGGAAGLVNGTGADSLKNADSLVTTPAVAPGNCSIALGNNAIVTGTCPSVAIGFNTCAKGDSFYAAVAIGCGSKANTNGAVAIGAGRGGAAVVTSKQGIAIGDATNVSGLRSVAIGANARATAGQAVALGYGVTASRANAITTCEMVACVAGKGLIVTSPDGLTTLGIGIDNSGNIVTYTP